jgi:hypothetical protein
VGGHPQLALTSGPRKAAHREFTKCNVISMNSNSMNLVLSRKELISSDRLLWRNTEDRDNVDWQRLRGGCGDVARHEDK